MTYHFADIPVAVDSTFKWCRSFIADPVDPPKTYILSPCTTLTCESLGKGGVPSPTRADHVRVSKWNTCVSARWRVPSCPPKRIIKFFKMTHVARYLALGGRPLDATPLHVNVAKLNSFKSDLYVRERCRSNEAAIGYSNALVHQVRNPSMQRYCSISITYWNTTSTLTDKPHRNRLGM